MKMDGSSFSSVYLVPPAIMPKIDVKCNHKIAYPGNRI